MNLTKIFAGLLLVLAVGLGLGAWMLSRQPARPAAPAQAVASDTNQPPATLHAVVVAAKALPAGQRLVAEDLKIAQLPAPVPGSFAATNTVLGRTTTVALAQDAPLFEQHLIAGLALQLESGQRAVSVAVKEPMAAGHHVRPGDFVDVFFTLDGKNEQTTVDTQTRLLLARSRVLAYGAASVENPPPTESQRQAQEQQATNGVRRSANDNQATRNAANTAVLAVPLADVERVTLAEKYGQLTLALRNPDDTAVPDPSLFAALPTVLQPVAGRLKKGEQLEGSDRSFAGLRFKDLASGADAKNVRRPAPTLSAGMPTAPQPPQPPRQRTVEVYQGATVQTVSY
ncbi:Flp pilus assembly protein CpaB [Comamonas humi]